MASFNGFVLTTEGRRLLAKALAGEKLVFTKMETGDGLFTGDVKTLTVLVNKKDDFNINQIENTGNGQVLLKAIVSNKNITTGYYIKEIGMFAHGDDNVEILYAYNKAIEADYFPAFNSSNVVEIEYQNYIIIDQAQNVTAVIDPSLTYLTKEEAANRYVKNTQLAAKNTRGIISDLDIRSREAAYILGAAYGDVFGTTLTSIIAGKTYYYWDSTKQIYIPYLALKSGTKAGGYITPDIDNFSNLSSQNMTYQLKNYSDFLMYLDRQTLILHIMKRNTLESTLEYVTSQIISFINNNDYTILPGTLLGNFNVALRNNTSKVYNAYGIFQSTSTGIAFFFGESNTSIANNASYYFHSGEMKVKMEAK